MHGRERHFGFGNFDLRVPILRQEKIAMVQEQKQAPHRRVGTAPGVLPPEADLGRETRQKPERIALSEKKPQSDGQQNATR